VRKILLRKCSNYDLTECPCAGEKPDDLGEELLSNSTGPSIPLATNGEVFPWNNVRLPTFVRPLRYTLRVHPNLTTLEVKGNFCVIILRSNDSDVAYIELVECSAIFPTLQQL